MITGNSFWTFPTERQ